MMVAAIETNPYKSKTTNLVNITGQCANEIVKVHLTSVKKLGVKALNNGLESTVKVNLQTFYTQNQRPKRS